MPLIDMKQAFAFGRAEYRGYGVEVFSVDEVTEENEYSISFFFGKGSVDELGDWMYAKGRVNEVFEMQEDEVDSGNNANADVLTRNRRC
jgi:hypothetical protein